MVLVVHSLVYGLILSVVMCGLFVGAALVNREIVLRGYPPDIKAAYGPLRPETFRQRKLLIVPMLLLIGLVLTMAVRQLPAVTGLPLSFGPVFMTVFLVLMTFNLVDLLILDWLIFVKIQPAFTILPGTEGLAGYRDYAFHFHGFLKGTIGMLVVSLVIAGVVAFFNSGSI